MKLNNRKVVITGASGGIGSALAAALAAQGCRLLLSGRKLPQLEALRSSLAGGEHSLVVADLTSAEGVEALANAAEAFGADTLVNCLGVNALATVEDCDQDMVSQIMNTNLVAPINTCRAMLRVLRQRERATILNVGSILGSIGYAGSTLYCASKFGLRGFTEALRRELSDSKVDVIYVAPRATATALNSDAMNQMNEELGNAVDSPEAVARKIVSALQRSGSGRYYFGRMEAFFVRLNALFPSLVDRAVMSQLKTIKAYCTTGGKLANPGRTP